MTDIYDKLREQSARLTVSPADAKPATDLRTPIAKARDEYLLKFAALDGAPSGQYLRNRIEAAFVAGWVAGEKAALLAPTADTRPGREPCATCGRDADHIGGRYGPPCPDCTKPNRETT